MIVHGSKKGFTLVEIMIVVAIIGLLAAIAVPNFMQARQSARTSTCINNLRQIESSKEQWALETGQNTGAVPDAGNLTPYLKSGTMPTCPIGLTAYTLTAVGTSQTCPNATVGVGTVHPAQIP